MASNDYLLHKVFKSQVSVTILESMTSTVGLIICALIVGRYLGSDSLVAYQLVFPLLLFSVAFSGLICNGGSISCSVHLGEGDFQKVNNNYTLTLTIGIIGALAMALICFVFAEPLSRALGASGEILPMVQSCVYCLALLSIPFMVFQVNVYYFKIDNDPGICVKASIAYFISILLLSVISVFFTDLGLFGVGLSLVLGTVIAAVVTMFHFHNPNRFLKIVKLKDIKEEFGKILLAGLPTTINRFANTIRSYFMNSYLIIIAGHWAILAYSVQSNVGQFAFCVSVGFGLITANLCGMFFGERDKSAIESTMKIALKDGVLYSALVAVAMIILAEPICGVFLPSDDITEAVKCLRWFALTAVSSTVVLVFLYMYQSTNCYVMSNVISFCRGILYTILFAIVLNSLFGVDGVWASFFAADVFTMITITAIMAVRNGKLPRHIGDYIAVPRSLFEAEKILEETVDFDSSAVASTCDVISTELAKHGVEHEKIDVIHSYVSELMECMVVHGNNKSKGTSIDIRVIIQNNDVIIRFRNDDNKFNPLSYVTGDKGWIDRMRIVPKEYKFRYCVNLNNILITI